MGCDFTKTADPDTLVVEAFIETNQPPPSITVRQTRPLDRPGDSTADAATGAEVRLALDEALIPYDERPGQPGLYAPTSTPPGLVSSGASWRLRVRWKGETARAAGTVPPPITLAEVCANVPEEPVRAIRLDSLRRDSLDVPAEESYIYPIEVTMAWQRSDDNPAADTTRWVRPELQPDTSQFSSRLVDRFLQPVEVRREDRFNKTPDGTRRWEGVYAVPVDTSISPLPAHDLQAIVVRGDSTFGDFARTQTDADFREPISNVEGGLGIATAVAIDSLMRTVEAPGRHCWQPGAEQTANGNPAATTGVQSASVF